MADTKMNFTDLEKILGLKFKDVELYQTALTHRSYLNEHRKNQAHAGKLPIEIHNERLEFLGDAVLELVVTEHLYLKYQEPEGILTNWRSALVKTESLSEAARKLAIEDYLLLSRGERRGSDRARRQILANTFEALIGAIYLDHGYKLAKEFIERNIIATLDQILAEGSWLDAKTKYQELAQEIDGLTPVYKVLKEIGPDHDKTFTVGVYVGKELRGQGSGASKQAAQQKAAEDALKKK